MLCFHQNLPLQENKRVLDTARIVDMFHSYSEMYEELS